jgi:hypothetical protein
MLVGTSGDTAVDGSGVTGWATVTSLNAPL